jgi:dihydroorotase
MFVPFFERFGSVYCIDQLLRNDGFEQVVQRVKFDSSDGKLVESGGKDHPEINFFDDFQKLEAAAILHLNVEKNNIRFSLPDDLYSAAHSLGFAQHHNILAVPFEQASEGLSGFPFVVNDYGFYQFLLFSEMKCFPANVYAKIVFSLKTTFCCLKRRFSTLIYFANQIINFETMNLFIANATIVNEGRAFKGSVFIKGDVIEKVVEHKEHINTKSYQGYELVDASGKYLIPGVIDDQVHFREPGLTHKADLFTESRAAVAGGITSFMEMPNTIPNTLTQELLEEKFRIAAGKSLANYSFYMGASNDNLGEIVKTDPRKVCGVKVFMGASTGNMLVDNRTALENIYRESPALVAVHCEDEATIKKNSAGFKEKYGNDLPIRFHPKIRSAEACYKSSSLAVDLATKYNTRLHVLHISTAKETSLFTNQLPLGKKRITAEVCVHHLWFSELDYETKGTFIKWNPAIKTTADRDGLFEALLENRLDVVATDHAPHTLEEKRQNYFNAPSGGPLVQHALVAVMEFFHSGKITMEKLVGKMCHAPAECFRVERRGFIRTGYFADLVVVDPNNPWQVERSNILSKCRWSPFEGTTFKSSIYCTIINGNIVYRQGVFDESKKGERLMFNV